jgi:hypothetical protein
MFFVAKWVWICSKTHSVKSDPELRVFHLEWSVFVHNIHLLRETQRVNAQGPLLIDKGVIFNFEGSCFCHRGVSLQFKKIDNTFCAHSKWYSWIVLHEDNCQCYLKIFISSLNFILKFRYCLICSSMSW